MHENQQELEAIKERVKAMEAEAEKLKELQSEVESQMSMGDGKKTFQLDVQLIQLVQQQWDQQISQRWKKRSMRIIGLFTSAR